MVGTLLCSFVDVERHQVATVKYVVDAEIETVGVKGDYRAETYLGVYALEACIGEAAHGVAAGNIVEVAADNHVGPSVVAYESEKYLGLSCTLDVGGRNLAQKVAAYLAEVLRFKFCKVHIEVFVALAKSQRLQVHVEEGEQFASRQCYAVHAHVGGSEHRGVHAGVQRLYRVF